MNSIDINTSQNVNISFDPASIGERILAFIIDMVIKVAYFVVIYLVIAYIFGLKLLKITDQWSLMAIFAIISLPVNLYTLLFESFMEGQTPGKRIMKIKVVKRMVTRLVLAIISCAGFSDSLISCSAPDS